MDNLTLKYLGTAAAESWPGVFCMCDSCKRAQALGGKNLRMRSSVLINDDMLVDMSPDFFGFKIKYDIDVSRLKYLLVTHTHLDHFYPQIFGYNDKSFSTAPIKPFNVYCSGYTANLIKNTAYENLNALDNININITVPFTTYKVGGYNVTPLEATHSAPESLIYLIEKDGTTLLYANDTYKFPQSTYEFLGGKRIDIASFDATMGLKKENYFRHLSFWDIINIKDYFIKNGNCDETTAFIATHFTHFIDMSHSEIEQFFAPYNIITAYDGMKL